MGYSISEYLEGENLMSWKRFGLLALWLIAAGCGGEPDPTASVAEPQTPGVAPLPLTVVSTQDISYPGTSRKVSRVVLDVEQIPTKEQLRASGVAVWSDHGRDVDEFSVFLYLPEMNHEGPAYAAGSFTRDGIGSLATEEASLYGHPWYAQTEMAKRADAAKADFKRRRASAVKHEYNISIEAELRAAGVLLVHVVTDFPDKTIMNVGIGRDHWQQGKADTYSGELYRSDLPVEDGAITFSANLDDANWIKEHEELVGIGIAAPIAKISNEIEVSVLYSPMREQPESVVAILGEDGENVSGEGADDTLGLVVYQADKTIAFPVKQ
jgi:hypothetical protein